MLFVVDEGAVVEQQARCIRTSSAIFMPFWPNWLEVLALEARGSRFESEEGHQFYIQCPCGPTGRGIRLKIEMLGVRFPPGAP